jgi:ACS family glucarate transporter-like MFS transporter
MFLLTQGQCMRYRNRVLGLLSLLTVITYLDRVCISVAGPRIQDSLHLTPAQWGWVGGIFTLSYGAFEIPTGLLGDRIGARRVLTRVVLWWSAFTTFTGMVGGYYSMLVTRFFFGAGEAGAYPNISVVIARWVPVEERGRAFGFLLAAAQVGGAIAPLLVVPIQIHYGWRASFYVFGIVGVAWAALWYSWFRDSPAEMSGVTAAEIAETEGLVTPTRHMLPWGLALRSINFWRIPIICFCYIYTNVFFLTWFHTYLVKARGFSEKQLLLSSLPFLVAACANLAGGLASHLLVKRVGLKWGRCSLGVIGLGVAGLSSASSPSPAKAAPPSPAPNPPIAACLMASTCFPPRPILVSRHSGAMSRHFGAMSRHSGTMSRHSGAMSRHSGAARISVFCGFTISRS